MIGISGVVGGGNDHWRNSSCVLIMPGIAFITSLIYLTSAAVAGIYYCCKWVFTLLAMYINLQML